MKLWEKGYTLDHLVESFTTKEDRKLDILLAEADALASKAHADMLAHVGLIAPEENAHLQKALDDMLVAIKAGDFIIEEGVEDIHSQIEVLLTRQLGATGKKIHLARSRNDQVLVALRLFFRNELTAMMRAMADLIGLMLSDATRHKDRLIPGFTHMQLAMVSSFGMWFAGFAEALTDDLSYMGQVRSAIDRNPLGTAAGYGSSMPIDRDMTTRALHFEGLCVNPINAQLGRGKTELLVSHALSMVGVTLSKMAMDVSMFTNPLYGFMTLPDELTTGSSIMPHKKNPDVFEILRARANILVSLPGQVSQLIGNLPSGYHRDFQILKELLFPALKSCGEMIRILTYSLPKVEILPIDLKAPEYRSLFSVELVNQYVQEGMPFRDAYHRVAEEIATGTYQPPDRIDHTHIGSIGNLGIERIAGRCQSIVDQLSHDGAK